MQALPRQLGRLGLDEHGSQGGAEGLALTGLAPARGGL
jgi:hypothetical protein